MGLRERWGSWGREAGGGHQEGEYSCGRPVQPTRRLWGDLSLREIVLILSPPPDIPEQSPWVRTNLVVTIIPPRNTERRHSASQQVRNTRAYISLPRTALPAQLPFIVLLVSGFLGSHTIRVFLGELDAFCIFAVCAFGGKILGLTLTCL